MFLYEINKKGQLRKYLVAAGDTQEARTLVQKHLTIEHKEFADLNQLEARFARESEARQRTVSRVGGWAGRYKEKVWDIYQRCKRKKQARVITSYLF